MKLFVWDFHGTLEKGNERGVSAGDLIAVDNAATYLYAHPGMPHRECEAAYKIRDLREVLREI